MKLIKLTLLAFFTFSSFNLVSAQNLSKTKKNILKKPYIASVSSLQNSLDYTFLKTTGTYANLVGATSLNNNQLWKDTTFDLPIGFGFTFFDQVFTDLDVLTNGVIGKILAPDSIIEYSLAPYVATLKDRGYILGNSISPISYKLDGISPNKILKIEFRNAGFFEEEDSLNTLNYFTNFQTWIFETSHKIEYHYGPTSISNINIAFFGDPGPIVGLARFSSFDDSLNSILILEGNPSSPSVANISGDSLTYLTGVPANGTIYRFTKNTVGLANSYQQNSKVRTYPNPAFENINLSYTLPQEAKNAHVILYDLLGKEIQRQHLVGIDGTAIISLKDLANGTYLYKVLSSETGMLANGKLVVAK